MVVAGELDTSSGSNLAIVNFRLSDDGLVESFLIVMETAADPDAILFAGFAANSVSSLDEIRGSRLIVPGLGIRYGQTLIHDSVELPVWQRRQAEKIFFVAIDSTTTAGGNYFGSVWLKYRPKE